MIKEQKKDVKFLVSMCVGRATVSPEVSQRICKWQIS
jgi:hypothetical protein